LEIVLGLVHIIAGGSEFWVLEAAMLKPQVPKEMQTNGTESRLVFDNLRQW